MRRRSPTQAGFTLVEVLIAMMLMIIILSATLTTLEGFNKNQRLEERRVDAQEALRRGMDQLEGQLRNLATPATNVKSINRAEPMNLVFQTADPQKRWVRYCIDPADPLIDSGRAGLWYQVSSIGSATPPTATNCPQAPSANGWGSQKTVGSAVVNARNALNRPVFTYNWPKDGAGNDITTDTSAITRIRTELWVDVNPGKRPLEQRLTSGVFLRNQNQAPVADFTASGNGHGVILNASETTDHEGRRLEYYWYYGASPAIPTGCRPPEPAPSSYLGTGIVLSATFPATVSSPQTVTLCVVDPGDLTATTSQAVTFS
jgi:prepilin-type N-terminal cleavage/methylation domain-containing protein